MMKTPTRLDTTLDETVVNEHADDDGGGSPDKRFG